MNESKLSQRTPNDLFTFEEIKDLGKVFLASGFFKDIKDSAQAIVKIMYGRELGFSPVTSIMGIHIIEGKPELSANILASLVKSSGRYNYRVTVNTNEDCCIEFSEGGTVIGESRFSIQDAQRAGIARQGSGWTKYPKAMCFARAMSQGVRTHCPDVSAGVPIYTDGELSGNDPTPKNADTENVNISPATPVAPIAPVSSRTTWETNTPDNYEMEERRAIQEESNTAPSGNPEAVLIPLAAAIKRVEAIDKDKKPEAKVLEFVTSKQITAFNTDFRMAAPTGMNGKDIDYHRHEWLKEEGYVDTKGNGTTKAIPVKDGDGVSWVKIKNKALKFARTLKA
jgi:hypothetical protein